MRAANNNRTQAGTRASQVVTMGPFNRYGIYAVHTRFDDVAWFVSDAEHVDEYGTFEVVGIYDSFDAAVAAVSKRRHCDDCGRLLDPRYYNDTNSFCSQCDVLPDVD